MKERQLKMKFHLPFFMSFILGGLFPEKYFN